MTSERSHIDWLSVPTFDLSEVVEMLRADIYLPTFDLSEVVGMLRADIFLPTFDLSEVFLSVW
jgi:hypothetical protein